MVFLAPRMYLVFGFLSYEKQLFLSMKNHGVFFILINGKLSVR